MKRTKQRPQDAVEQVPVFEIRGALTIDAQAYLDLPSQARTDEEKLARRLARARRNQNLLDDSGPIALPKQIPLATIRMESARAMKVFQEQLEEKRKKRGARVFAADFIEMIEDHIAKKDRRPLTTEDLVSLPYFDWRLTGIVTQPRDQRPCNSCWAHAATGAFESRLMYNVNRVKAFNTSEPSLVTQIALSVQGVMDCVRIGNCETGGSHTDAFEHFVKNGARLLELNEDGVTIDDLTTPTDEKRGPLPCQEEGGKGIRALTWDFANPRNPLNVPRSKAAIRCIKTAVLSYGAIAVNLTADKSFHDYKERKYTDGVYDVDRRQTTNHNALLTGWDDDRHAWIIVNSFGRDWGGSCVDEAKVMKHFPWTIDNVEHFLKRDKGCMYIRWGVSKVGELAAWIETHLDNEEWLEKARIEMAQKNAGKNDQN